VREVDAEVRVLAVRIGLGMSESTHRMVKPSRRRCEPRPQGSATVAAWLTAPVHRRMVRMRIRAARWRV
jgi:hypothetical protein